MYPTEKVSRASSHDLAGVESGIQDSKDDVTPNLTLRNQDSEQDSETEEKHEHGYEAISRVSAVSTVLSSKGHFRLTLDVPGLKIAMLFFLFLQGYSTGLDGLMSGSMQTYAVNWFKKSGESGAINTVKSVVSASVFVPFARLSDRFGRIEMWLVALFFFTIGRIVTAATPNYGGLFVGTVIWQIGYAGFRILAFTLLADLSDLRDRTLIMNIYVLPIIINLWVSGDMVSSLVGLRSERLWNWRWGYGMFCIIVPFTTALLVCPYAYAQYIASKEKKLPRLQLRKKGQSWSQALWELAQDIDLIGMLLFAAVLCLVLIPLTIAGGLDTKWRRAYIIAMICVGGCLIPVFLAWEWWFATRPFIPKVKLDRTFYLGMLHEFCWRMALSVELTYIRFLLLVAFNQTSKSAQRLGQFYDFMQASTSLVIGVILHFYPRPKLSVIVGGLIGVMGFGLMYKYRSENHGGIAGFIGAEIVIGIGGSMMRYPTYTLVHASVDHDQMAVTNGFLTTMFQVGGAVGSAVGTAIWTQKMPSELVKRLGRKLGMEVYKSPISVLKKYPLGTPERTQILEAYAHVQRILVIISLSLASLIAVCNFAMRNYKIGKKHDLTDEDRAALREQLRNNKNGWFRELIGY